jgi:hypothetical protein
MFETDWLQVIPDGTWQGGVRFLNTLAWNITWGEEHGQWKLWAGDRLLFSANQRSERDAFVLGMTIALAVLPERIIDEIKDLTSE